MKQIILTNFAELDAYFARSTIKKLFLVCGKSIARLSLDGYFQRLEERHGIRVTRFMDFSPNPQYDAVVRAVELFRAEGCDAIAAVGGGSAMDVAKCVKLFCRMDESANYLTQTITPNDFPLLAIPTTAGSGSEATRYAVVYHEGKKQSVVHENAIPSAVFLEPSVLDTLPQYQRKTTMLDAFCHALESYWSVNSTDESKAYSREVIRLILSSAQAYLQNDKQGNANMLKAANIAGKAINITETTAGHAMCYKLTSLYGIAHGHAAALCVSALWPYMASHSEDCCDPRGEAYLQAVFSDIAAAMGQDSVEDAIRAFHAFLDALALEVPVPAEGDYDTLSHSVNPTRLKNNPVSLNEETISSLYHQMLNPH